MNIDKYRMLLEAADTGSLSKAAEKFGYTPSGMVHIVNSIEQEFSFPILQRSNKGVSLTADGERIVPILREIVKWDEQLRQVSSAICGKIVGDIMVGSYFSIAMNWLPEVIRRFHEDYPNVHISVIEGTHQKLDQLLYEQRADFCLFSYPPEEGVAGSRSSATRWWRCCRRTIRWRIAPPFPSVSSTVRRSSCPLRATTTTA